MEEMIKIEGTFSVVIFRNDITGYTVTKFKLSDLSEKNITVTGYFKEILEDFPYVLQGKYVEHVRYGMQFQVESYKRILPEDQESLIRYFSSSLFAGIGKKSATCIVETLGNHAISMIKENPDVLMQVKELNEKKRESIIKGINENDDLDDSIMFFTQHGLTTRNIMKLEAAYGDKAVEVVKNNPYQLIEDIDGIGFVTADKLAKALQFEEDHPYRKKAVVFSSILKLCMRSGNSFTTVEEISRFCHRNFNISKEDTLDYLNVCIQERLIIVEEERIYHSTQFDAENGIAKLLFQFMSNDINNECFENLDNEINEIENKFNIIYEEKQKEALLHFLIILLLF